jgi:hypothetical protein
LALPCPDCASYWDVPDSAALPAGATCSPEVVLDCTGPALVDLSTVATGSDVGVEVPLPAPDCGTALSLSRVTLVRGFGFSPGVAVVVLSDDVASAAVIAVVDVGFGLEPVAAASPCCIAPGIFAAVAASWVNDESGVAG